MISIVMSAGDLPDHIRVRKEMGTAKYVFTRKVEVYGEGGKPVTAEEGTGFLVADAAISIIPLSRRLALDFDDEGDAIEFLQTLQQ